MAGCYANENFPLPVVEALRELGHNLLTTYESGKAGQAIPDEDILAFATGESRIILTLNRRHFIRLHQTTPDHSGITCLYLRSGLRSARWPHPPRIAIVLGLDGSIVANQPVGVDALHARCLPE